MAIKLGKIVEAHNHYYDLFTLKDTIRERELTKHFHSKSQFHELVLPMIYERFDNMTFDDIMMLRVELTQIECADNCDFEDYKILSEFFVCVVELVKILKGWE